MVVNNRIPMWTPLNTIERHTKENLLRQRTHMKLWLLFICIDQRKSILRYPFAWYCRRVSLFDNESFGERKKTFYCFGVNFPYLGCKLFAFAVVRVTYGVYPFSHRAVEVRKYLLCSRLKMSQPYFHFRFHFSTFSTSYRHYSRAFISAVSLFVCEYVT